MIRQYLIIVNFILIIYSIPTRKYCNNDEVRIPITLISDQDALSKIQNASEWYSLLRMGDLYYNRTAKQANIIWLLNRNYTSYLNSAERGMEFSDLIYFDNKLLTIDDKTGIVYWITNSDVIPLHIIAGGDGQDSKRKHATIKGEWMTQKDNHLYIGSTGNGERSSDGQVTDYDNFWIKRISTLGVMEHLNWYEQYVVLRDTVQARYPGYLLHESGQWSEIHKKWFFLPRHMSKHSYDPRVTYREGANVLISTSDCFCDATFIEVGTSNTTRGFSAFQFLPCTNDEVIVAVKSEEIPNKLFKSFIMMLTINGEIIMDETELAGNYKFEGIEFYDALANNYVSAIPTSATSKVAAGLVALIYLKLVL